MLKKPSRFFFRNGLFHVAHTIEQAQWTMDKPTVYGVVKRVWNGWRAKTYAFGLKGDLFAITTQHDYDEEYKTGQNMCYYTLFFVTVGWAEFVYVGPEEEA